MISAKEAKDKLNLYRNELIENSLHTADRLVNEAIRKYKFSTIIYLPKKIDVLLPVLKEISKLGYKVERYISGPHGKRVLDGKGLRAYRVSWRD